MNTDLMVWQGLSGRSYEFWVYSMRKEFGPFGAVFFYALQTSSVEFEMLYINQTDRMDLVPKNPVAEYIIDEFRPNSIHVWKCPILNDRKSVMTDLLVKYKPPGNKNDKSVGENKTEQES